MSELKRRWSQFTQPHWENFDDDFRKETREEPGGKVRLYREAAKLATAAADARLHDFSTRE